MTTVLVTRPYGVSDGLAAELESKGYEPFMEPVLKVEPIKASLADLEVNAIMVTSGHALIAYNDNDPELVRFFDMPCFCIGPRSADRAKKIGFTNVYHSFGDGEDLAKLVVNTMGKKYVRILHLSGSVKDPKAKRKLEGFGYRVTEVAVYDTVPVGELSKDLIALLKARKVQAVTLFSPRTAEVFGQLMAFHQVEMTCERMVAICLSTAVADVTRPLNWRAIACSERPHEESLVAKLQEICPPQAA